VIEEVPGGRRCSLFAGERAVDEVQPAVKKDEYAAEHVQRWSRNGKGTGSDDRGAERDETHLVRAEPEADGNGHPRPK